MSDTKPGGEYRGTDGELHDANGNKIGSKENKAFVDSVGDTTADQGNAAAGDKESGGEKTQRSGANRSGGKRSKK